MNYAELSISELKKLASERKIPNRSTMKKAGLVAALEALNRPEPVSFVEMIVGNIRNAREARSNAGRVAGSRAKVTTKMSVGRKTHNYLEQRSNVTICNKLTARQERRIRKTERAFC